MALRDIGSVAFERTGPTEWERFTAPHETLQPDRLERRVRAPPAG